MGGVRLTGRQCDSCSTGEELKKFYTLTTRKCSSCKRDIQLCWDCMRFHIDHSQLYNCKICRRDIKLKEIGI